MKNSKLLHIARCIHIFAIICLLQGCVNAAVTSAQAVYDRHNIENTLNDHYITMQASRAIYWTSNRYKNSSISINTFNGIVLLTGQTPSPELKDEAGNIVKRIPGARKVYNFIEIISPASSLVHISDAWITSKIKARFIADSELDPSQIKVVTENGTVYLMGIVFPSKAKIATTIARTTDGVQHVVQLFSYLQITEGQIGQSQP